MKGEIERGKVFVCGGWLGEKKRQGRGGMLGNERLQVFELDFTM